MDLGAGAKDRPKDADGALPDPDITNSMQYQVLHTSQLVFDASEHVTHFAVAEPDVDTLQGFVEDLILGAWNGKYRSAQPQAGIKA